MAESLFIKADEVSEVLGVARAEAYRIIKRLNGELAAKGYAELKKVRDELRDLTVHKANYEELRDLEEKEQRKGKEHGRE